MIGFDKNIKEQTYSAGLEGYVAGQTRISKIDGKNGKLWYRGYELAELCKYASFEEVSYLIIHGDLPNKQELELWNNELREWREPPRDAMTVLQWLPENAHPLMQYRTMLSVAACLMPEAENTRIDAQWRRPARILAWTASLAAAAIRHRLRQPPVPQDPNLGFAANFLWQTLGRLPGEEEIRAFEVSLIVQAEHGLHAAALAALVVISTGADLGGAVLAGMGALSGQLHGGANQTAFENIYMLENIDKAKNWVKESLKNKYRFPGYGHRIYKTHDPRVTELFPYAEKLLVKTGNEKLLQIYNIVRKEIENNLGKRSIYANVDSVTGLVYHPLGLPPESFPIPFALAIQTGWMAHCLEYIPAGRMIEPVAVYLEKS